MDADTLGALGGLGGLITALFLGVRAFSSDRFKQRVQKRADAIAEYEAIIRRLNEQHALDRAAWVQEKADLRAQWERERAEVRREWDAEKAELREQIETLQAQVYALMNRPANVRTRKDDR